MNQSFSIAISIFLFGTIGVLSRAALSQWIPFWVGDGFPWATLLVNILGSLGAGVVYVLGFERGILGETLRIGLMVGLLGGFTTFSTFMMESFVLFQNKGWGPFLIYIGGTCLLGIFGFLGGLTLTRLTL